MIDKLIDSIEAELKLVGEQGINASNLESTNKLVDMYKDLEKVKAMKGGTQMRGYGRRYDDYYNGRGYSEGGYNNRGYNRMRERLDRINDGMEMYDYGRERYQHGDSEERVFDGLERLMYAICSFVESTMDFAESPQEKEIIRKHIQKMSQI